MDPRFAITQKPTVGRIVLYHRPGAGDLPAMITGVSHVGDRDVVDLEVLGERDTDERFPTSVYLKLTDDERKSKDGGRQHTIYWYWPPRS